MKKAIPYIIIVVLLAIIFLMQQCEGDKTPITVTIPEEKGSFDFELPTYVETDTVYITKWKEVEVKTENPVNDSLAEAYTLALDSLERYKMYVDAIQIRKFKNTFEDSVIKIDVFGEVQGDLNKIGADYTIKERDAEVEQKQTVFRLLAGLEMGQNTQFNDFRYKANLGFQNKKGNVFGLSYERYNKIDYIWLRYDFSFLNFKR